METIASSSEVEESVETHDSFSNYRQELRRLIDSEVKNVKDEEIKKATQELLDEQKKAIIQIVEEHKLIIREVVEEEKKMIWEKAEALRRSILNLGL